MAEVGTLPSLYAKPERASFNRSQAADVELALRRQYEALQVLPIVSPEDLLIDADGRTRRGGYRFTLEGLNVLGRRLASGFMRLVLDVSSRSHSRCGNLEAFSLPLAAEVFNQIIRLRFSQLHNCTMLCDTEQRLLHGVFPRSQLYYPNIEFWDLLQELLEESTLKTQLFAAQLHGRQCRFWFRCPEPFHVVNYRGEAQPFWAGYFFANGDFLRLGCSGRTAIISKHGTILFKPATSRWHIPRLRKNFHARLTQLARQVLQQPYPAAQLRQQLEQLTRLPFVHAPPERKRDWGGSEWYRKFQRFNLTVRLAEEICEEARLRGSLVTFDEAVKLRLFGKPLAGHTRFDLLCAVQRVAKLWPYSHRQRMETAAYELLLDNPT